MRELQQVDFYEHSHGVARRENPQARYVVSFAPPGNTRRGVARVHVAGIAVADAWLDAAADDDVSEELDFLLDLVRARFGGA